MIDRKQPGNSDAGGVGKGLRRFQRKHHLSNRTMVSLFIFLLMVILIAVYVVQLRNGTGRETQSSSSAVTASEYGGSAASAEPSADTANRVEDSTAEESAE